MVSSIADSFPNSNLRVIEVIEAANEANPHTGARGGHVAALVFASGELLNNGVGNPDVRE